MTSDQLYLNYILETIANIEELAQPGLNALQLQSAKHDRAAILYYLQTMAETTQRLSEPAKSAHPEMDWAGISGFRNRLVHGYLEVNFDVVWGVIENYVPELKHVVLMMLQDIKSDES